MSSVVLFIGPPGSGKGTCASRVSAATSLPHISLGELIRDEIRYGSVLGEKCWKQVRYGELVSDDVVNELLQARIDSEDCRNGFLLDGYPRTFAQVEYLNKIAKVDLVIHFPLSRDRILQRLAKRVICCGCGEIYNLNTLPPKKSGICDKCGDSLVTREDESTSVIDDRIMKYNENIDLVLNYYGRKGIVQSVETVNMRDPPSVKVDKVLRIFRVLGLSK